LISREWGRDEREDTFLRLPSPLLISIKKKVHQMMMSLAWEQARR
jgi:hypothetical protein